VLTGPVMSGRLIGLRPVESTDLDFLADLANHAQVRTNVVGWDWPVSRDAQAEWHKGTLFASSTRRLAVTSLATGELVGLTGLWDVDWHNQSALTAVKLMPGLAPKGAGTDSIMLTMAWSFYEVGLRRLHSTILEFNAASIGAYVRKCGWQVEGREREAVFRHGRWNDQLNVAILRPEFEALPDAAEYVTRVGSAGPARTNGQVFTQSAEETTNSAQRTYVSN
jgi:RimJ/RimL family protein N-acetyltransferase